MGTCSSSSTTAIAAGNQYKLQLSPSQLKLRRSSLISLRNSYASVPLPSLVLRPGLRLSVDVTPWVAPPNGARGVDDALSSFQRGDAVSTAELNRALAGLPSVDGKYDYGRSVVLSLTSPCEDSSCDDVTTAALFVEHSTSGGLVLELIWFITRRKEEGKGNGSALWRAVCQLAAGKGAAAIVVTSTPSATAFWHHLVGSEDVMRTFDVKAVQGKKVAKLVADPKLLKGLNARQQMHLKDMLKGESKNVCFIPLPDESLVKFYRNFKGAGDFTGKPFRYTTEASTHFWFRFKNKAMSSSSSALREKSGSPRNRQKGERSVKER